MANYQLLKADIDKKVYQNGRQEITGQILNSVLNQMVTTLGAGYQFAGVATTATNPGSPDAKVFYIANGKGRYTNFGGLEVTEDEVVVLYWDSSWHKVETGIASQAKLSELETKNSQLCQKVEKLVSDSPVDFSITDESGNAIIEFSEGHFRTKEFDSKTTKEELNIKPNVSEANHDFDIMDESNNVIASFSGGHFRTKNFSSKDITDKVNEIIENGTKKNISILFVGNSMTQDAISYLPYVLKEIAPGVDFKFYIYFTGGFTLAQQYENFINEWIPGTFSICENSIRWINHTSWESSSIKQSMKAWLQEIQFDVLCLQDYFSTQPTTDNAVTDFNNCVNYIRDNYDGQFKVVNLFHRPRTNVFDEHGPQSTIECFNMIKTAAELCMKNTACQSVMAPGVAAYFATLDSILQPLGDIGNLTPDGSHAQDTLGCLLQAYTVALWLFDEMGLPYGIYNNHIRINQTLFNAINPPGPNVGSGIIVGTDAENNEAQLIAVKAFKYGLNLVNNSLV